MFGALTYLGTLMAPVLGVTGQRIGNKKTYCRLRLAYTTLATVGANIPSYTDSSLISGQTYFYVVTAMGTNSVESGYSNEAVATVP